MPTSPPLSLRQVRAIEAVAQCRGFAQAAALLNSSQPVISRTIASAEKRLGHPIFQRGWDGTEPTAFGELVIRHCSNARKLIARAEADIFALSGCQPGLKQFLRWHHLDAVAATVRYGSTKLAAEKTGVSQPAISRAISDLTDYAHQALFRRRRDGLEANAQARRLASLHEELWQVLRLIGELPSAPAHGLIGRLAVGLLPFSGQDMVAKAFGVLTNSHPDLRLMALPGSYDMLADALVRGEIDCILGILRYPPKYAELKEKFLYYEDYALVARHDHACHRQLQTMSSLRDQKWIVAQHGTPIRAYFERLFEKEGEIPPTQTCEIHSFNQAEQVIINSDSIGLLAYSTEHLARLRPELGRVVVDLPDTRVDIGMTTCRADSPGEILAVFEQALSPFLPTSAGGSPKR